MRTIRPKFIECRPCHGRGHRRRLSRAFMKQQCPYCKGRGVRLPAMRLPKLRLFGRASTPDAVRDDDPHGETMTIGQTRRAVFAKYIDRDPMLGARFHIFR